MQKTQKKSVILKRPEQIELMRKAGRVVRKVLQLCHDICKPGMSTQEVDRQCYELFTAEGCIGLFKGYASSTPNVPPFPGNICISLNDEVVHGIGEAGRIIKDGDVVSIDCGVKLNDWCGDAATTVLVGNVDPKVRRLCTDTQHCLDLAIDNIRPGRKWSQIARLMQNFAERGGYGVVKNFVGHGVGQSLHEEPQVPNYYDPRDKRWKDFDLRPGLVIAVEPMCILGSNDEVEVMADGWTVKSKSRKPAAHYEHTLAVTNTGVDILTDGK